MRALLAAVVLTSLLPSSLYAASFEFPDYSNIEGYEDYKTLYYEHEFVLETHDEFVGCPVEQCGEGFGWDFWFSTMSTGWLVPGFDLSIGTPLIAFMDLQAIPTFTYTIDPPDTWVSYHLFLVDPFAGMRVGAEGYSAQYGYLQDVDWTQPIPWPIYTQADSHAFYDITASSVWDIKLEGVARATYFYKPVKTAAVPEPTTLLLLGSGLIGAEWKRRRK